MENESAIVVMPEGEGGKLALQRPPEIVLEEAARAAKALKSVIDQKPRKVIMNDEVYLEFEDWQVLGRFYGYTVREDGDPEPVTIGDASGFKASAVVINRDGQAVSRATAYCLNDEEKWSTRAKYVYCYVCRDGTFSESDPGKDQIIWDDNPSKPGKMRPRKERRQVGEEKVPLFQLASMAQTRAGAKALRNVLSWVVVMAGYRPTPAEEMDGVLPRSTPVEVNPGTTVEPTATGDQYTPAQRTIMEKKLADLKAEQEKRSAKSNSSVAPPPQADSADSGEVGTVTHLKPGVGGSDGKTPFRSFKFNGRTVFVWNKKLFSLIESHEEKEIVATIEKHNNFNTLIAARDVSEPPPAQPAAEEVLPF